MRILLSETDAMAERLLTARLEALGHDVTARHTPGGNLLSAPDLGSYDILMAAPPHPVSRMRQYMGEVRAAAGHYPYVVLIVPEPEPLAPRSVPVPVPPPGPGGGINAALRKPLDLTLLPHILENAERLTTFLDRMEAAEEEGGLALATPIRGVLEPAAFAQVTHAAMDRIARGRGGAGLVAVVLEEDDGGKPEALGAALVDLHRKSEILGRVGAQHFALLLQDTHGAYEAMTMEARIMEGLAARPEMRGRRVRATAIALPGGQKMAEHTLTLGANAASGTLLA
ncbi:MAG TPA: hypothetical protein DDX54_00475 [Rhodospirillaceae bacterium]|nr:hypothetical protein [Alphaproteobacteria bacterium]HBH25868.1 hypothetical protein [Rhodospirillaceae bacterium]